MLQLYKEGKIIFFLHAPIKQIIETFDAENGNQNSESIFNAKKIKLVKNIR
tara:strand:- start:4910 stop:5062 length:153 start_codon:yes stop_codon:yes gene_type:complete